MSTPAQTIQQAIAFAQRQLGQDYVWGGESRGEGGFDCSGLIYAAYRAAGYTGIGRTTYQQITQGVRIPMNKLRPGDLVFPSRGHVGLYIGNGKVLSSPHTGAVVHISSLGGFGYMTARRLIQGGGGVIPPVKINGQSPTGLPIPASNKKDRAPRATAGNAAALLTLLSSQRVQIPQGNFQMTRPNDVLAQLGGKPNMPQMPDALGQLAPQLGQLGAGRLPQIDLTKLPGPGGQTPMAAVASLDATRRSLLRL